jgi:hypothetical protein
MPTSRNDPTLDDLLGDPVTHAIMRADRVDPRELEAMLRALALRLARPAGRSDGDARDAERVPFERNAVSRFLRSMGRGRSATSRRVAARSSMRSQLCGTSLPW